MCKRILDTAAKWGTAASFFAFFFLGGNGRTALQDVSSTIMVGLLFALAGGIYAYEDELHKQDEKEDPDHQDVHSCMNPQEDVEQSRE